MKVLPAPVISDVHSFYNSQLVVANYTSSSITSLKANFAISHADRAGKEFEL